MASTRQASRPPAPSIPIPTPRPRGPSDYKAHTKTDGESGDWVLIGTRGRVKQDLHVLVKDRAGRHKAQVVLPSPRGEAYFHDFFWASPYAVFLLQPALLSPLPMVLGFRSYTDSLRWTPSAGGLLVVSIPRASARP